MEPEHTVSFIYTHPVTDPPRLAGQRKETRALARSDAERLQELGYGTIQEPKKGIIKDEPGTRKEKPKSIDTQ